MEPVEDGQGPTANSCERELRKEIRDLKRLLADSARTDHVRGRHLADESPEHQNFSPETLADATARMVMVVDEPDVAFARAIAAGATVVSPVTDQYDWRLGRVVDPFGHDWEIGKPLSSSHLFGRTWREVGTAKTKVILS
jgi:hypothetical protein